MSKPKVTLIVLDGWGHRLDYKDNDNAVYFAKTPNFDFLAEKYGFSLLSASEEAVGLPKGQVGNSEIGHTTIGAGKVLATDLVRIANAFKNKELENNEVLNQIENHLKQSNGFIHLLGLYSRGGVHSHLEHFKDMVWELKRRGLEKIAFHLFTDGRDTSPKVAKEDIQELENFIEEVGVGVIASISGRYFAMDRDNNWDRLDKFEKLLFKCDDNVCSLKPSVKVADGYEAILSDEFIDPVQFTIPGTDEPLVLGQGDAVLLLNFRPDRMRMLTSRLLEKQKEHNFFLASMTSYSSDFSVPVLFPPQEIETTLAKEISKEGLSQFHIAETEKYPHATYFLNGGQNEPHQNEVWKVIESRKDVKTHDEAPEMRAQEITDAVIDSLSENFNFTFINFANPDMVGHTGNFSAIVKAVEKVDEMLGVLVPKLLENDHIVLITADHGNAEVNFDFENNSIHTAHTTNLVPFILVSNFDLRVKKEGTLADLAPTVLELFKIKKPDQMTGVSLILD